MHSRFADTTESYTTGDSRKIQLNRLQNVSFMFMIFPATSLPDLEHKIQQYAK